MVSPHVRATASPPVPPRPPRARPRLPRPLRGGSEATNSPMHSAVRSIAQPHPRPTTSAAIPEDRGRRRLRPVLADLGSKTVPGQSDPDHLAPDVLPRYRLRRDTDRQWPFRIESQDNGRSTVTRNMSEAQRLSHGLLRGRHPQKGMLAEPPRRWVGDGPPPRRSAARNADNRHDTCFDLPLS